jgi:hypothetical protein
LRYCLEEVGGTIVSQEEDGGKPGAKVIDLTQRVKLTDTVTSLAHTVVEALTRKNATVEEYMTALILAMRVLRRIAKDAGLSEDEIKQVGHDALRRAERYGTE